MAVPIAAIGKKALEILGSNEQGRKFLGYIIGIALFLILLPAIVLYALFGGITGNIDSDQIIASLSADQQEKIDEINDAIKRIREVFTEKGLTENDVQKAQELYIGLLIGQEVNGKFYDDLAWCFQNVTEETSLYDNLASQFSVTLTDEEKAYLDGKFGVTGGMQTKILLKNSFKLEESQ